jgi:hypothetical protein
MPAMAVSGYHYAAGSRDVRTAVGHAGSIAQMPSRGLRMVVRVVRIEAGANPANRTLAPFPVSVNALIAPPSLGSSTRGDRRSALESWKSMAAARYRDEATPVRHVLVRLRDDTDPASRDTASRPSGSHKDRRRARRCRDRRGSRAACRSAGGSAVMVLPQQRQSARCRLSAS